jgi:hypothetical protein
MALGRTQVEDLTNVLRSMLVQIEQAMGSSVNNMGAALTALMADLSSKVVELTEQTRASMVQTSQASADVANSVLKNASDWTATSKDQLAVLIEKHTNQLSTADRLRASRDESATRFTAAASQFNSILTKLQQVTTDAGTCTTAMSGAAKGVPSEDCRASGRFHGRPHLRVSWFDVEARGVGEQSHLHTPDVQEG